MFGFCCINLNYYLLVVLKLPGTAHFKQSTKDQCNMDNDL